MNPYNLLAENWIPVRRADGKRLSIPPWRITDPGDGAPDQTIADIDSPRPDFKGALLELLIGLVQTALPPEDLRQWRRRFNEPPSPDELQTAFDRLIPHFNLFGDRPRFLQDLTLSEKDAKAPKAVSALLMDTPGDITLDYNKDFFIKRHEPPDALCPACAAAALYALQAYSPAGGAGHRTSMRGGGPLTTIVIIEEDLWKTVWANVLPLQGTQAEKLPDDPAKLPDKVFPWLAPTRESKAKGTEIHSKGMHFLHHYWAMPRRVVLMPEPAGQGFACPVCGLSADIAVREYRTKNYGNNYGAGWRHPLTPYRAQKPGEDALSLKGQSDRRGYNHWLGLVYGDTADGKFPVQPAAGPQHFSKHSQDLPGEEIGRLRAYGYDFDKMKPLNWCEGEYPIYSLKGGDAAHFAQIVSPLLQAADQARRNLKTALKEALFGKGARDADSDGSLLANIDARFWDETQSAFYGCLPRLIRARDDAEARLEIALAWRGVILPKAVELFVQTALDGGMPPGKEEQAYGALNRLTAFNYTKCSELLGIPKEAKNS
jgi:CRISPR system Cascade subunit CasA